MKALQEDHYVVIIGPFETQVITDMSDRDVPATQQLTLVLKDVFVQNIHLAAGSARSSSVYFAKT